MPKLRITLRPGLRLQIKHGIAIGPGKAQLLELIAEMGSITQAAKAMEMGYRTAWELVTSMNGDFAGPLVESSKGGAGGGGAQLTLLGAEVLRLYRLMESRALRAIAKDIAKFESLLRR